MYDFNVIILNTIFPVPLFYKNFFVAFFFFFYCRVSLH